MTITRMTRKPIQAIQGQAGESTLSGFCKGRSQAKRRGASSSPGMVAGAAPATRPARSAAGRAGGRRGMFELNHRLFAEAFSKTSGAVAEGSSTSSLPSDSSWLNDWFSIVCSSPSASATGALPPGQGKLRPYNAGLWSLDVPSPPSNRFSSLVATLAEQLLEEHAHGTQPRPVFRFTAQGQQIPPAPSNRPVGSR